MEDMRINMEQFVGIRMASLYRLDKPAVENSDGSKEWWLNGQRHREDGPQVQNR